MTTKQSARPHLVSVNRDCFVVLHTQHHHSALLAMTRSGLFQQSLSPSVPTQIVVDLTPKNPTFSPNNFGGWTD